MKKLVITFISCLVISSQAYAETTHFVVDSIGNSCNYFNEHTINFKFKDNSNARKTVDVSIWKWSDIIDSQQQFYVSDYLSTGVINLCQLKNNKKICEIQDGFVSLNKPFKYFKPGDYVNGEIIITHPKFLKFKFEHIVSDTKNISHNICD